MKDCASTSRYPSLLFDCRTPDSCLSSPTGPATVLRQQGRSYKHVLGVCGRMGPRNSSSRQNPKRLLLLPPPVRVRSILRLAFPYACLSVRISQKNFMPKLHEIFYTG